MKGMFKLTDKLERWLELKGWSQTDLARELACDDTYVSQILNNAKHPSWQILRKCCILTGLDVGDLIYFDRNAEVEEKEGNDKEK